MPRLTRNEVFQIASFFIGLMMVGLVFLWLLQPAPANAAGLSCYVEGSAGVSTSTTGVNDGTTSIDLGADGGTAGLGGGCDVRFKGAIFVGALARYDFASNDILTSDSERARLGNIWTIALRGGIAVNDNTLAYVLIGGAGTEFDVTGIANTRPEGIVYGGGIEMEIDQLPFDLFVEFNRFDFGSEVIDGDKVDNTTNVFRAGARYRFGG